MLIKRRISDERFMKMNGNYEAEQHSLIAETEALEAELAKEEKKKTDGAIIGRMEYYYGQRNSGNYTTCNQPILQRWIVNKEEIENLPIQMATDAIIIPRK